LSLVGCCSLRAQHMYFSKSALLEKEQRGFHTSLYCFWNTTKEANMTLCMTYWRAKYSVLVDHSHRLHMLFSLF
jgi:hypothetical protein